jgi:segregation and condensation protein B
MPPTDLSSAIEALLFASDQPLSLTLLCDALEAGPGEVSRALQELGEAYAARGAGVELREIAGGWMLVTSPAQSEWVGRMLRGKRKMRLSRAALETMAIIAYKQPVTKSEVEAIRGVDSSAVLGTLLERNLVTIRGRSKVVGRPLLYGTTQEFLDYFGLKDLSELPRPEELRALVAAREPEQLDMMELEVVSQVASDLAASEAAHPELITRHEIVPLGPGEESVTEVATDFAPTDEPTLSDIAPAEAPAPGEAGRAAGAERDAAESPPVFADEPGPDRGT